MRSAEQIDAIVIGQSEITRYEEYSKLPVDRIEMFKDLVHLRMVHLDGRFTSHLDVLNYATTGKVYAESSFAERREMLNIWNLPGLSSLLVASAARHDGFNVKVIHNFDSEFDRFVEYYDSQRTPPLVGISTTFHLGYAEVKRMVRMLRAHDPGMKIVLGGAFANEQTINGTVAGFEAPMRKYGVDYILHAFNSDADLSHLLRAVRPSGPGEASALASVPNLAYIDEAGAFGMSNQVWNNPTLDSKPMLWQQLDLGLVNRTVQLRAASGCPFACSFCTYPDTAGGHFAMELAVLERQLEDIKALGYVDRIIFVDDTFNVPVLRFKKILEILCRFDFEWFSFLRVQYLTDETARLMKQSGCRGVYLGIESSDDGVLRNMNKKATRDGFLAGMELLNRYEIPNFVAFVIGFPGETEETIAKNIRFLESCDVDFYSTKEFYYMPHASVHKDRDLYGLTGMGNRWSHATMDSTRAAEMKVHMFREVKSSIFIDPDTSLWYLAYLHDQGLSLSQIKDCQRIINRMMLDEIDGIFDNKEGGLRDLRRIVGARPLTSAGGRPGAPAPVSTADRRPARFHAT